MQKMSLKKIIFNISSLKFQNMNIRYYCSNKILESAEEKPIYLEETKDNSELEKKRNKSRLSFADRNRLFEQKPYNEPIEWYHNTIKYKKRILGRYGMAALGIPAGLAWPTLEEVEEQKEYEKIAFPLSIQERLQKIKEEKKKKEEILKARQIQIANKMSGMEKLIAQIKTKIAEKEAAELESKERKERKIEEIRRQLIAEGTISKHSLTEAITLAEKDEKKKKKELKKAKMLERQKRLAEQLIQAQQQNEDLEAENKNEADSKK
ncbi:inner centromere protein [Apis laboriosa]|uniref:inner centromere protein n=1 Tax=Apis laboriosa TaxID=183418 RepID=UPI001CC39A96|nr:inner centromere protein [Apis laboriosa]